MSFSSLLQFISQIGTGRLLPFTRKSVFSRRSHNEVVKAVNALYRMTITRGGVPAGTVKYADSNVAIELDGNADGSISSGGNFYGLCKSHHGDYITCRSWNGIAEGMTDVQVAKPYDLRFSITSEIRRGDLITYSTWDETNQTRVATGPATKTQVIDRQYNVNDPIAAISAPTGIIAGGSPVTWLDTNSDARAWLE